MMKSKSPTTTTMVVKLGMEYFTTSQTRRGCNIFPEVEEGHMSDSENNSNGNKKKDKHEKGAKKDGRFYKFVKKHFLQRKSGPTTVQEIHIVPEGDELRWARRSAGSGTSRSSEETTSTEGDRLEVVHDMADEYLPEAV